MVEAVTTATEMKNHFGKYLQMVINGNKDARKLYLGGSYRRKCKKCSYEKVTYTLNVLY